ncbi:MAG: beta-N-acetylhexosaminidase [Rhizobiales bacterium]|nr:beta-N-acetylhexosaminidase [Hyphomicrobiales bacterium]
MVVKAFISGVAGPRLEPEEAALFRDEQPWGLILFKRNCREPAEIRDLVAGFREAVGRPDAPVLIDQEGGRVQRLQPPNWPPYPPGRTFGLIAEQDEGKGIRAAWLQGRLMGADLADVGVSIDCVPVLDVAVPGVTDAIGNRSFGGDPQRVATLGRAMAEGMMAAGLLPTMKHMPGHGRAVVDSHYHLPVVDADLDTLVATDFAPFAALADLPIGMTSHVVYRTIDPERPATTSPVIVRDIIRGRISFRGLLLSDDVSMNALSGDYGERARAIRDAGVDIVLHCNGRIEEMRAVADASAALAGESGERAARALSMIRKPEPLDRKAAREELVALANSVGWRAAA